VKAVYRQQRIRYDETEPADGCRDPAGRNPLHGDDCGLRRHRRERRDVDQHRRAQRRRQMAPEQQHHAGREQRISRERPAQRRQRGKPRECIQISQMCEQEAHEAGDEQIPRQHQPDVAEGRQQQAGEHGAAVGRLRIDGAPDQQRDEQGRRGLGEVMQRVQRRPQRRHDGQRGHDGDGPGPARRRRSVRGNGGRHGEAPDTTAAQPRSGRADAQPPRLAVGPSTAGHAARPQRLGEPAAA